MTETALVKAINHETREVTLLLDDGEIFDIAANATSRCFITKLQDALGTDADGQMMKLDSELRRVLTVGRPIAERPADSLTGSGGDE